MSNITKTNIAATIRIATCAHFACQWNILMTKHGSKNTKMGNRQRGRQITDKVCDVLRRAIMDYYWRQPTKHSGRQIKLSDKRRWERKEEIANANAKSNAKGKHSIIISE